MRADQRVGVLREQGGELGQLAAHLGDVVGVVHAHAHGLPGIEHERGEVGGVECVLGAGHVLVALRTVERVVSRAQQRPDIGVVELDEHVALDACRVRPVTRSDRRQPHRGMLSHTLATNWRHQTAHTPTADAGWCCG